MGPTFTKKSLKPSAILADPTKLFLSSLKISGTEWLFFLEHKHQEAKKISFLRKKLKIFEEKALVYENDF